MPISVEHLADLSPNMRKVLREHSKEVLPKNTYWITLQGMIARGLISPPSDRRKPHRLTKRGEKYRQLLLDVETNQ